MGARGGQRQFAERTQEPVWTMRPSRVLPAMVAAAAALDLATLPPKALALSPLALESFPPTVAGAYHIHTRASDGSGTVGDVAAAAARAGLQFVIMTDHGDGTTIQSPSYHSGVLCIEGVEVSTTGGHYVALGLGPTPFPLAGEPRDVVADVARWGGFGIVAHPYSQKLDLRWQAWNLATDGIEWLNGDSEWRERSSWQLAAALTHYPFRSPETLTALFTRPVEPLSEWDRLTGQRRVVGLVGADAHAKFGRSPVDARAGLAAFPGYEASFRALSIHVEPVHPLEGNAVADARSVLAGVEAGHLFSSLDGLAHPAQFGFTASSGRSRATEGDDLILDGPVDFHAAVNNPAASLVLSRNGVPVGRAASDRATFRMAATPAVYRIEAHVSSGPADTSVPWIVSNPIYVLERARSASVAAAAVPAAGATQLLLANGLTPWHTEPLLGSATSLTLDDAGAAPVLRIAYALGPGRATIQQATAVYGIAGVAQFDRLAFEGQASRAMRVSVQLRDASGAVWRRSVYLDATTRPVIVPFADLRPMPGTAAPAPDLTRVRGVLFVVDLTNNRPGDAGTIRLSGLRLER